MNKLPVHCKLSQKKI